MGKKAYTYLLIGAAIVIVAAVLWLTAARQPSTSGKPPAGVPTARPTKSSLGLPSPTPYPGIPPATLAVLVPGLPYENSQFLVEYLPKSELLYVTVYNAVADNTNYQAALRWLEAQGVPLPSNNRQVRFVYFR